MILILSVALAVVSFRFAGEAGRRRFDALTDKRALAVHDQLRGGWKGYFVAVLAIAGVDAAVSFWIGSVRGAVPSLCALGLTGLAMWWEPSARANVVSGFAARGLEPLHQRETSQRRSRRTRQFMVLALGGFLAMSLLRLVEDADQAPLWLGIVAMTGIVAVLVGVLGAGWAAVWRYGDEEPDRT